jgi:hypothetical protein
VSKVVNDVVAIKVSTGMSNWLSTVNSRSASNRSLWALDSQIETTWKPRSSRLLDVARSVGRPARACDLHREGHRRPRPDQPHWKP